MYTHQTLELVLLQTFSSPITSFYVASPLLYTLISLFLLFSRSFSLSSCLPSLPAFFISGGPVAGQGSVISAGSSNYLNFVCISGFVVCACTYVCVPKHFFPVLFPAMSICHRILGAESVNHSASSSQKYISAPSVHTPPSGSH